MPLVGCAVSCPERLTSIRYQHPASLTSWTATTTPPENASVSKPLTRYSLNTLLHFKREFILLRTSAGLQPHRRRALSPVPGIAASGRQHDQPAACSRASPGSRSCRRWLAESRVGRGN